MHCSSCAGLIEKELLKISGIKSVNVNFASENALIHADSSVSDEMLILAIKKTGYQAVTIDSEKN